jgi:hypothetical protein
MFWSAGKCSILSVGVIADISTFVVSDHSNFEMVWLYSVELKILICYIFAKYVTW